MHDAPRPSPPVAPRAPSLRSPLSRRFSLFTDKADDGEIDRRLRDGAELQGATPWILMFAILVASIGLNVNSTAVIIGAMLISPLMGPIMGVGHGLAIYDFRLLRRSLLNLLIATLISLAGSSLYFAISPLAEVQSELLARTTPTLWDVLVALFGGLAGIIGATRREPSNVIPGVAIATALMPPICTAGFALATGRGAFFLGALYLYSINCVFIALATLLGVRALRLPRHDFVDPRVRMRVRVALLAVALATAIPSGFLAARLVRAEIFRSLAAEFVAREFALEKTHVAESRIDPANRRIEIGLIGEPIEPEEIARIESRLPGAGLAGARLLVVQAGSEKIDLGALRSGLLEDLYRGSQEALRVKEREAAGLAAKLAEHEALANRATDVARELRAFSPEVERVVIGDGIEVDATGSARRRPQLFVATGKPLPSAERRRIEDWFAARVETQEVDVIFQSSVEDRSRR